MKTRIETLTDQAFELTQRVKALEVACIMLSISVITLSLIGLKEALNGSN